MQHYAVQLFINHSPFIQSICESIELQREGILFGLENSISCAKFRGSLKQPKGYRHVFVELAHPRFSLSDKKLCHTESEDEVPVNLSKSQSAKVCRGR